MLKTCAQSKKYLYSLFVSKSKKELFNIQQLLQKFGNPHKKFKSIHITGTSGKGSTAYLISKIMQQTGYKIGLHLSPHLQNIRERMQINGSMISNKDFVYLVNLVKSTSEKIKIKPSYFEALMVMTFCYFAQQKVDLAIVEAGCGGKYDCSNVLEPELAVITNIGLDHTELLGRTKERILRDKMQIIKPCCIGAISGIEHNNLQTILRKHCQSKKVPLLVYKKNFWSKNEIINKQGAVFDFQYNDLIIKNIRLSLLGYFQIQNACLAITTCLKFAENNKLQISIPVITRALSDAHFAGRIEIVKQNSLVILDGAHNQNKIKALTRSIEKLYKDKKIIIVFGLKKNKQAEIMLKILNKISNQFIITQFGQATDLGEKIHYKAEELFKKAKNVLPAAELSLEPDSYEALKLAQDMADAKSIILITGSLYLIGEMRKFLKLNL